MANDWNKADQIYDYCDENGNVIYQVLRWNNPKSFGQRAANGKGGWKASLTGVERVPFMLPKLLDAVKRGETIYVVEGEKDSEALYKLGLMATTNAQGAKARWPDVWADYFAGAVRVVVIADNDKPGLDAANQRAGIIARVCPDTRIIAALPGEGVKDASDWIAAGGTVAELERLAEAAPLAEATKAGTPNDRAPVMMPIMEEWRQLTRLLVDDGRIGALTPGGPWRDDGARSMRCPLPGHTGREDTKPSAWIGAVGTDYIWACDKHDHLLLLPFLVESRWAKDKDDARLKLQGLGYTLPVSPARDLVPKMDGAATRLAITDLLKKRNDIANGQWFARLFASCLRYNRDRKVWYIWDGRRWRPDKGTEAQKYAKAAVNELLAQAQTLDFADERRNMLIAYALKCGTVKGTDNMLKMAQSEDALDCGESDFDSDPWLLNVLNGTIDLRTGELRPHRQEDFISKLIHYEYDPEAHSEFWEKTLFEVFEGREETVNYVQRAVGYSLTGDTSEECFFLLYGTGRNGKGTFIETLQALLKEYRETAQFETFLARRSSGNATPELAQLAGSRVVVASESADGRAFATAQLKNLTGGDEVKARFLYANPFTYKPQFKIWLVTNDKPKAPSDDYAFWERCKVVPFKHTFERGERDNTLKPRLKDDLQGVLSWCVAGCKAWRAEGLGTCPDVEEGTHEYQEENDQLAQWIAACCVTGDGKVATTTDLLSDYANWAEQNGIPKFEVLNPTAFGRALTKRGYERDATGKKRLGIGLRVREEQRRPF
jgi:putative DNA primase/helicase